MNRYIDVEAVLELIQEEFHKTDVNGEEQIGILKCHRIVREAPTADVVEVRHGHWITQEEAELMDSFDLAYTCSVCGHLDWDCTESETFNYCPNCGAKMDGERREE